MIVEIESYYPKGYKNRAQSQLVIEVSGTELFDFVIQAKTWTEKGSKVLILHKGEQVSSPALYNREKNSVYNKQMASDIAFEINSLSSLCNLGLAEISEEHFFEVCDLIVFKCEKHAGKNILNCDCEVLVIFK